MAEKVTQWKSDDGRMYDNEKDALIADAKYWRGKYEEVKQILDRRSKYEPQSGYGSSGGGGHD